MPVSQTGAGEHGRSVIIMNLLKTKLSSPWYLSQDQLHCPSTVLRLPQAEEPALRQGEMSESRQTCRGPGRVLGEWGKGGEI